MPSPNFRPSNQTSRDHNPALQVLSRGLLALLSARVEAEQTVLGNESEQLAQAPALNHLWRSLPLP